MFALVLSRVLCSGAVQGAPDHVCYWAVSGCCPGCCAGVLSRVLRIMFAIGWCQRAVQGAVPGAVQGAPDHVCHWAVSGCCPGWCAGMLSRVLRIMFAIGWCQRAVQSGSCLPLGCVRVLLRVLCRGGVQGAPDNVCHYGVRVLFRVPLGGFRCCPGCSPGCCQAAPDHVCHWAVSGVLSRVLSVQGAVQGAPDHVCHWAVSGCC